MIEYKINSISAGFTMRGANTDSDNPPPIPKQDTGPQLVRDSQYPTMVQNGVTGGGGMGSNSSGGGSSNPESTPSARRPFNYERHADFPWGDYSQYEAAGNDARKMPWGTTYRDHVIEKMQPSQARYKESGPHDGRSLAPRYIELSLAYGDVKEDSFGRTTYTLGDLEVGARDKESFVYHAKYTRKLIK